MKKINDKLSGEWFEGQWTITGDAADVEEYIAKLVNSEVAIEVTKNSFRTSEVYNRQCTRIAGFMLANGAEVMANEIMTSPPCTEPNLYVLTLRDRALGFLYGQLISFGDCEKRPYWEEMLCKEGTQTANLIQQFGVTPEELFAEMDRLRPNLVY